MSSFITLRSLGTRRALLNTRSMHSPFGAMAPRATLPSTHTENPLLEFGARLNVVASAPVDKFNGVPLGAFQVSMPYYGTADGQAGNGAVQKGQHGLRYTTVEAERRDRPSLGRYWANRSYKAGVKPVPTQLSGPNGPSECESSFFKPYGMLRTSRDVGAKSAVQC
ncbi:hypothetical protein B0H19DRAFT_1062048 [Mycena capillaripes]|nr:hypothetical protein B0H19DRAFT_1062048 [Mycena capillaripes]